MKLSDDEKSLLQIQYQKMITPLRKKFYKENEGFYPELSEMQRMNLHKSRVENYLKEILNIKVRLFIDIYKQRKKGNQLPEEFDCQELSKEMRMIVDTLINQFAERYRNNIFSSLQDEVIEKVINDFSFELPSLISEAILPLGEFIQLTKISENAANLEEDECQKVLSIIKNTMLSQSRNPIKFKDDDEDSYRNLLISALRGNCEWQVNAEAFNKKGKTDILIQKGNEQILIAECKIWGREKLSETINQLFKYVDWHSKNAAIIIFSKNVSFEQVLDKIKDEIEKHEYYIEIESMIDETFQVWFRHPEDTSRKLFVSILPFNIYIS